MLTDRPNPDSIFGRTGAALPGRLARLVLVNGEIIADLFPQAKSSLRAMVRRIAKEE